MDIVLDIPVFVVVEDDIYENMRRIANLMDEVEINLVTSTQTIESKSQLIYAFNDLAMVYLISNGASDLVGVYTETYDLPSLCVSIKKILGLIERRFNKDRVFLTLTKKMRQNLLMFYQRTV
jgi:hypothetical protein